MQRVIMDNVEPARAQVSHQAQIGVMLTEEGDVVRLVGADTEQRRLVANRLDAKARIGSGGCEERHIMTSAAQGAGEHVRMHFEPTSERLADRVLQMSDDGYAHTTLRKAAQTVRGRTASTSLRRKISVDLDQCILAENQFTFTLVIEFIDS
jgi:hypothetical protein